MIRSVLVANRGEIARRVIRGCQTLGIDTVVVYAPDDAHAPHVREADSAVRLPGVEPAETYLCGEALVAAALAAGADAVHPGYGFLAENPGFARAVREAGLRWIGPPAEAIEAMADKTRAKELMAAARVPTLTSVPAGDATKERLPLLVKAAAGGGGRGMRIVSELAALPAEVAAARAEAAAVFGDGTVFLEPYVARARHVEVQVLADAYGRVWTLGTRDCSLQRRHQKVIEEAPAPGLSDQTRTALAEAATRAARAVDYRGAGTVEFLVAEDGRTYFLEMNTRLQVEHPVTESVYGLDLVALQLRLAEDEPLPPEAPPPHGHAVEARLCAEDPARDWAPQTGTLHRLRVPGAAEFALSDPASAGSAPRLRLDAGLADGERISVRYDPMLAKVVAWAPSREAAVRTLARALERATVHGPVTNRDLLVRSLRHPDFLAGRVDTGFYDRWLGSLTEAEPTVGGVQAEPTVGGVQAEPTVGGVQAEPTVGGVPGPGEPAVGPDGWAALAAALADMANRTAAGLPYGVRSLPARLGGWRNVPAQPQHKRYRVEPGGREHAVRYQLTRDGLAAEGFPGVRLLYADPEAVVLESGGVRRTFTVRSYGPHGGAEAVGEDVARLFVDSPLGGYACTPLPRFPDPQEETEPGSLLARTPGTVVRIADGLAVGHPVVAGEPLLWLEAMKMEHRCTAPHDGVLRELRAAPGQRVEVGTVLAVIGAPAPESAEPAPESAESPA
ncbi:biotin carboxylase N-terminal domain-containing protein [Streptomyces oceani]|uniref:Acety-l/propionyl-CoA carboxylase subunit alpha n=1 Tax=Streptomyces oceani TaxID=1075402 RepID=A0A1E7KMD5_9ACTN|nr:biotin carboxylase N-terminal domain-containing protein [Streptomyces oceani]OEV05105.1 acety-l/propionyl-CoA carboxylase subunit alpha [Streptomyces oceani]